LILNKPFEQEFLVYKVDLPICLKYEGQMREEKGLDLMDYEKRDGRYRIKLSMNDIKKHREFIANLIRKAKGIEPEIKDNDEKNI